MFIESELQFEREPFVPYEPFLGRLHLVLPGYTLDWTLHQDRRDLRRFRAVDLDGVRQLHCAPPEMLRRAALIVPHYSAVRAG